MGDSNYYGAINNKLQNKSEFMKQNAELKQKENEITNKLLYYYDKNFNSYYDHDQNLNAQIESRDQLIRINNLEFEDKKDKIMILQYILGFLFFIIILGIGLYLKFYSKTTLITLLIIGLIATIIVIYYKIVFNQYTLGEYRAGKFAQDVTSKLFRHLAKDILPDYMTQNRCPKGCRNKKLSRCDPDDKNCIEPEPANLRQMKTDSTLNVWEKGDILYKNCEIKNGKMMCPIKGEDGIIKFKEPEPWFGPTNQNKKSKTVYECEWENVGEPLGDQGYNFSGTIPCKYFPGYKTKSIKIGGDIMMN